MIIHYWRNNLYYNLYNEVFLTFIISYNDEDK